MVWALAARQAQVEQMASARSVQVMVIMVVCSGKGWLAGYGELERLVRLRVHFGHGVIAV